MANWLSLTNLQGVYTSEPIDISLYGDGAITKISWESNTPEKCKLIVQSSLSRDDGYSWSDWKICLNGAAIPDINIDTSLYSMKFRYRIIIQSHDYTLSPEFKGLSLQLEPIILFDNRGDVDCKPELWITKVGNGEIKLINTSNGNEEFSFKDLIHDETVYVNNEREHIDTSLAATYRYKDFNDNYLSLPQGQNIFKVSGNANIQFRYQFRRLQ